MKNIALNEIPYDQFFKNLLKKACPESNVECIGKELFKMSFEKEGIDIFLYGYDLGTNHSSTERICIDRFLTWLLLKKITEYNKSLRIEVFDNYAGRKASFEEIKQKLCDFLGKEKKIVIKPIISSVAEKEKTGVYKIEKESQVAPILREIGVEKSTIMATNFLPVSKKYRLIFNKPENGTETFLCCLQKEPMEVREDGLKASVKTKVINENEIPEQVKIIGRNVFQILNMKLGYVDIAECDEGNEEKYLVMKVSIRALAELFDYCEEEKLIELTKNSLTKLIKDHCYRKSRKLTVNSLELKSNHQKTEVTTREERENQRKEFLKNIGERYNIPIFFCTSPLNQNPLTIINNNVFMVNYYLGDLNNTISANICVDKDITSAVLKSAGIPCVEHKLFEGKYENVINSIIEEAKKWNTNVVVKKRAGSSGESVYHVMGEDGLDKLREAVGKILQEEDTKGVVISPYRKIKEEYRVLVLKNEILLIYKKNLPYVTGDGKSTLEQLIVSQIKSKNIQNSIISDLSETDLNKLLDDGEKLLVGWKHNLDKGAAMEVMNEEGPNIKDLLDDLADIAKRSVDAFGLDYATVDIIENEEGKKEVLEVNNSSTFHNLKSSSEIMEKFISTQLQKQAEKLATLQVQIPIPKIE